MLGIAGIPTRGGGAIITTIGGPTGGATKPSSSPGSALEPCCSGAGPGDLAENRAGYKAGTARVIEIEQPADQFAGGVEAGYRLLRGVEYSPVGVDAQAAKREGDAAGRAVGLEGRLFDRHRPIGLGRCDPHRAAAILYRRIIRHLLLHSLVEGAHGVEKLRLIDRRVFGHLVGQLLDCIGRDLGHLTNAVLVPLQMHGLLVEDLPSELVRLLEDQAAVFSIGVVAEIGPLVAEAHAVGIDHDSKRIAVLLEIVADCEITELGGIVVPADRMAARPVAVWHRADVERHLDAGAGVEAGAAHFGEIPAGAEIAGAHLGIALEAAGGEDRGFGGNLRRFAPALGDGPWPA